MRLIIGTDHCFEEFDGKVKDRFVFGREFFSDYLKVFDEVLVIARVRKNHVDHDQLIDTETENISFYKISYVSGIKWMLYNFSSMRSWLDENISSHDKILVRVPSEIGTVLSGYARKRNLPYMAEVIGDPLMAIAGIKPNQFWYKLVGHYASRQMRKLIKLADVVSYVNRSQLPKIYKPESAVKVDYISSIRLPEKLIVEKKLNSTEPVLRLVSIGSLVPIKNQTDMLLIVKRLTDLGHEVNLKIIGEGGERAKLESLCDQLGISAKVNLLGHIVDVAEIIDYLDNSDIFIFTSLSEGLPRSIIEAMSRGLPVVSSVAGGIPELVQKHMLCDHNDIEKYVKNVVALKENRSLWQTTSYENLRTVRQYGQEILSQKRVNLYYTLSGIDKS